jgi:HEAT repeat protein/tRNA A-37 threonylcarbamoyl transferase component Bud32
VALEPGSIAGPFRIVGQLGQGGMASVYRAHEDLLDRDVALKVLPREFLHDPGFVRRFEHEAQSIAKLEHPNIVPIYSYGIDKTEGIPWMAMRLVGGGSLKDLLKRGRLPFARSVAILRSVADALDYAHTHRKRIVHRDVKPPNVLLDEAGRVYLADFGIAKMLEAQGGLTATGMITGTPQYMAPEQATGLHVDHRADIYALGIMAYEMFTGHVPFAADTPVAILMKHVQEPLPLPPHGTVPDALMRAVLRGTAKKAEERWATAGEFVAALEAGLAEKTESIGAAPTAAGIGSGMAPPVDPRAATARPAATAGGRAPAASPAMAAPPTVPAAVSPAGVQATTPAPSRGSDASGSGVSAGMAVGLALGGVAVVAAAAFAAFFLLRRTPSPSPLPSPTAEARAAIPGGRSAPGGAESGIGPSAAAPVPRDAAASPAAAARATSTVVSRPAPAVELPKPAPTPVPTPTPTVMPAPAAPAAPPPDPQIAVLVAALSQPDAGARWRAAQSLGTLRAEAAPATAALSAALTDRSPDVRWRSAEALGLVGPAARNAVPALARAVSDPDPLVQTESIKALGLLGPASAEAVPALVPRLRASDVSIRRETARALARIGPAAEPAVKTLVDALSDKDKFVRMEAARALGRIGPSAREAGPALANAARDSEMLVAREAQAALKAIGN